MQPVKAFLVLLVVGALLLTGVGCGSNAGETTRSQSGARLRLQRRSRQQAAKRRVALRQRARVRAHRAAIQLRAREAHRAQVRQLRLQEAQARQLALMEEQERAETEEVPPEETSEESECDPNYSGACLNPYSSDYDCEGGSGNGPDYTGTVTVVGEDHYGLDSNGNGIGCEAE